MTEAATRQGRSDGMMNEMVHLICLNDGWDGDDEVEAEGDQTE